MNRPSGALETRPDALFVAPEAPYPAIGGGSLRAASLVEFLAHNHRVHLVLFREPGAPDPAVAIPEGRVARVDVIDLPFHSKTSSARIARNLSRVLRGVPPLVDRFAGFGDRLRELIAAKHYDFAILDHFWCAPYVEQVRPHARRVLVDLTDVDSAWHESMAERARFFEAAAHRRFATAARRLEQRLLRQFDGILVTSEHDAEQIRPMVPGSTITIYPNALPEVPAPTREERSGIAFSGNLEYAPNIEAIRFFRDRIWPQIRPRPGLKWRIIGKNAHAIHDLVAGDPQVEITGFVEDAIATLASAQIAVAPVLSGSGTRVKILEAWAAATPVVSTTVGAQGLIIKNGEDLVVADDPREFAVIISQLLDCPAERHRIGWHGRAVYERCYTWRAAWERLAPVFETAADQR
jgi:glycosyltransferase involved in cell wall biosynthesis